MYIVRLTVYCVHFPVYTSMCILYSEAFTVRSVRCITLSVTGGLHKKIITEVKGNSPRVNQGFSSNWPTGPIRSSSCDVRLSVCQFVCPFSCTRFWGLFCPHFGCPKFLEIRNPWGKVLERSGLRIEPFLLGRGSNSPRKKKLVFC